MGGAGHIRKNGDDLFLTDEKNYIIDADFGLIEDPYLIEHDLNQIEGVVCNGLFLDLADMMIIGNGDQVEVFGEI